MSNQKQQKKSKGKKIIFPVILAAVLVLAVAFTLKEYFYFQAHEVTDNAQVDADISPVISRVSGYVKEIRFTDNQHVKSGDTLAILDDRDFKIKLQQVEAALASAKQSVTVSRYAIQEAESNIATARANVKAAEVKVWKATEDFNRYKNLYTDHAITKAQYDAVKAEKESAEAALLIAQTQVPVIHKKVSTNEQEAMATASNVVGRQSDVDFARLQLSYTAIIAPASGIASKRNIQLGQLVQAGQSLLAIVNDKGLYITANFKETQMEHLKIGEKVDITVDAYPDTQVHGSVESFGGATGAKFSLLPPDNATGNFVKVVQRVPVRIKLDPVTDLNAALRPGMSVKVIVHTK
ncbi:HlyD family secretion protein [Agriterribacter sp.]|uniref:HlyD family secretion protein n=1 Tax=Agriterribacter sp. TaxID=2821509 RepID=UPI002CE4CEFC|nr:HlyD family secretion protein [Agriterribacter sp.]HRP56023.1 HlyD family secretion protein [Agriterribacter sp.]